MITQSRLTMEVRRDGWTPQSPPSLAGRRRVILDTETTGLRWWGGDRPIGIAVRAEGVRQYLPFRHAGGNLDEGQVRAWATHELAGKEVGFFNGPFDLNMMHAWGVDLEALGCTVFDVGSQAALLDDSRRECSLDAIAREKLGRGKLKGLNVRRLAEYHAADVEPYAVNDVDLTWDLDVLQMPEIQRQELTRVMDLEDRLLYVTSLMMREGSPVDEEKLALWLRRSEQDMVACLWNIYRETGVRVNVGSRVDAFRLFDRLGIEPPRWEPGTPDAGKVTFTKAKLRRYEHPALKQFYKARCLASLRSKYLIKYSQELRRNGCLRYSLHQLRVDDEGGTVSGRYSSSGFGTDEDDGINVQQVAGKKQMNAMKHDEDLAGYAIRELFVPEDSGWWWLSGDAEQIEYRLFAHYARSRKLLEAYAANPRTDFHNVVWEMLKAAKPDITRELTKDCNFAAIYGAGVDKWSLMMGITEREARMVYNVYHHNFPEARQLLNRCMDIAEERGFVRTILGRRRRFDHRAHDALSGVIQGSAGDEMKTKLVLLHDNRKETGFRLRFPVHDEVNGDVPDAESKRKVAALLDTQMLPTKVPLLWKVGMGPNWKECR